MWIVDWPWEVHERPNFYKSYYEYIFFSLLLYNLKSTYSDYINQQKGESPGTHSHTIQWHNRVRIYRITSFTLPSLSWQKTANCWAWSMALKKGLRRGLRLYVPTFVLPRHSVFYKTGHVKCVWNPHPAAEERLVLYSVGRYESGNVGTKIKALSCDPDIRDIQGDSLCVSRLSCDPIDFVFNAASAGSYFWEVTSLYQTPSPTSRGARGGWRACEWGRWWLLLSL